MLLFAAVPGCVTPAFRGSSGGTTCFCASESREARAKRTSDLEAKNGVGGVLAGFRGETLDVENAVVGAVEEGWGF